MADTVTLQQLRDLSRLFADERPGGTDSFVSDTEIDRLINLELRSHQNILVQARGPEYWTTEVDTATVSGTATVNLASDFFELQSLHLVWSETELEPGDRLDNIADREEFVNRGAPWTRWSPKAYRQRRLVADDGGGNTTITNQIEFFPTPTSNTTVRYRYVRRFKALSSNTDSFDAVNGFDRLIGLRVARQLRMIQSLSTSALDEEYKLERADLEAMIDARDMIPARVRDVTGRRDRVSWWKRLPRYD